MKSSNTATMMDEEDDDGREYDDDDEIDVGAHVFYLRWFTSDPSFCKNFCNATTLSTTLSIQKQKCPPPKVCDNQHMSMGNITGDRQAGVHPRPITYVNQRSGTDNPTVAHNNRTT